MHRILENDSLSNIAKMLIVIKNGKHQNMTVSNQSEFFFSGYCKLYKLLFVPLVSATDFHDKT